jgi:hypothetical protein
MGTLYLTSSGNIKKKVTAGNFIKCHNLDLKSFIIEFVPFSSG